MAKAKARSKAAPQRTGKPVRTKVFNPPPPKLNLMAGALQAPSSIAPPPDPRVIYLQTQAAGSSGIKIYAGYFAEEYLINELHGTVAADRYDEMRRSDAKLKMALNAVKTPIIAANWEVQPFSDDKEHQLHAQFINHVLFCDMDRPFSKMETLSLADFGHSVFEITHKPVFGHPVFGDYIGLKSLGWRSPRSILYWRLDPETGKIDHIRQLITGDLERFVEIPGQFLLVASLEKEGDLYEGVSLLRSAFGAWRRKNLYLKLMAIGIERNAVPMPYAEIPAGKENSVQYQNLIASLENYTSHENSYLVYPEGWKVGFLTNPFDPEKLKSAIELENSEMVSAFMANFLLLGSTAASGSRAVSMDQSEFFLGAIQYVADEAVCPHNHKLIPELIKMKYGPQAGYPQLKITGISDKAGAELAEALYKLASTQWIQPDDPTEDNLRKRFSLPKKSNKGVRIVQAPKAMQQGNDVQITDNPEAADKQADAAAMKAAETRIANTLGRANLTLSQATALLRYANVYRASPQMKKGMQGIVLRLAEKEGKKVEFQADDNPNICPRCAELDGQVFDVEDAPALPIHPNCECTLVPHEG